MTHREGLRVASRDKDCSKADRGMEVIAGGTVSAKVMGDTTESLEAQGMIQ